MSSASGCADMPPGTSTPAHLRGGTKPSNLSTVCDTHILDKTLPNYRVGGAVSTGTRYASMISLSFSNQRYWLGTFFGIWRCTILYICSSTRVRRGQSIVVVRSCSFRDGGGHSLAQLFEKDFVPNTDVEKGIVVFKRMHCQGLAHGSLSTVASVLWTTITGLSFENSCSGKRTTILNAVGHGRPHSDPFSVHQFGTRKQKTEFFEERGLSHELYNSDSCGYSSFRSNRVLMCVQFLACLRLTTLCRAFGPVYVSKRGKRQG